MAPSSLDDLRRLCAYDAWAHRQLAAACTDAHERAIRLLAHALTAELVWVRRMRGEQATTQTADLWPTISADDLRTLADEAAAALGAFVEALRPEDLRREAVYRNSQGVEFRTPFGDVLTHVFLHGHYHRGQAAAALREAGTAPPWTDFIVFARQGG